jgi:putative tryptophan/tyrosine transport system substrate-binding protein
MRRREFITLLGGAVAWPFRVGAQQGTVPIVGFLSNISPGLIARPLAAFEGGLAEAGYMDGQNVKIEYHWAEGRNERLPELAANLVQRQAAVIVATGGGVSARAAKAATKTIPIVFSAAADPVELGLVASLNRPGGNATGVFLLANSLEAKRLGLLHEMVPNAATIAVMVNPHAPGAETQLREAQAAASTVARRIRILSASSEHDLETVFPTLTTSGPYRDRREFIGLLAGAAAWPLAARAQQPAMPVIGYLSTRSPDESAHIVAAFRQGLSETGFVEGQNVTTEYRFAEGHYGLLSGLAADLIGRPVNVLVATGGTASVIAAKPLTPATIPLVFAMGGDPVELGIVTNLARPGGNATGVSFLVNALAAKQIELLQELAPRAAVIGFLVNPKSPNLASEMKGAQAAAAAFGQKFVVVQASGDSEFDQAFETLVRARVAALFVEVDAFLTDRRARITSLAARYSLPAIYALREFVAAGGLMSYGTSITDANRQIGIYAGRILKGTKPAELPVVQSTRFELVINLKIAKALGLEIPPTLLARANEVIE